MPIKPSTSTDMLMEAIKVTPPAAVAGAHVVFGLTLSDWVAICTLIYIAAQLILLIPKYRRELKEWRDRRRDKHGN